MFHNLERKRRGVGTVQNNAELSRKKLVYLEGNDYLCKE